MCHSLNSHLSLVRQAFAVSVVDGNFKRQTRAFHESGVNVPNVGGIMAGMVTSNARSLLKKLGSSAKIVIAPEELVHFQ